MPIRPLLLVAISALVLGCEPGARSVAETAQLPLACGPDAPVPAGLGVVVLHGKGGSPGGHVAPLVSALASKGVAVAAPTMPWSGSRIYDRTFDDAMTEIDEAVARLRDQGAARIVVAGHSQGATAAVRYGATRAALAGVIVMAAGGSADMMVRYVGKVRASMEKARALKAEGKGGQMAAFDEFSGGPPISVRTTPDIYLSYLDPDGPAVIERNALDLKAGTPVLWVYGSRDRLRATNKREYAFDKLPPHPRHAYVVIDAGHLDTPANATSVVASWLACL